MSNPVGGGLMYSTSFQNVSVTDAAQDIFEFVASATASVIIHSATLMFVPAISNGIAQDVRGQLRWVERSTTGSGGTAVTPAGENPRNTVAAVTTTTRLVTTPGTIGDIRRTYQLTTINPMELIIMPSQRLVIQPSGRLCLNLVAGLGAAYSASCTIVFEEI
jgi:hypothetical protein